MSNDYAARRVAFVTTMRNHGMDAEGASYCISVAKRLKKIYFESQRVEELEAEAVTAFKNFLGRLTPGHDESTGKLLRWDCIIGERFSDDGTVLHVVPPDSGVPVVVPLPSDAETPAEGWPPEKQPAQSEVQAILDAWNRAQQAKAEEKKPAPDDIIMVSKVDFSKYQQQFSGSFNIPPETAEKIRRYMRAYMDASEREAFDGNATSEHNTAGRTAAIPEGLSMEEYQGLRWQLYAQARHIGWDANTIKTDLYEQFVAAMAEVTAASKNGRIVEADSFRAKASDIVVRLQDLHRSHNRARVFKSSEVMKSGYQAHDWWKNDVEAPEKSLDYLREKQEKAKRKAKRR